MHTSELFRLDGQIAIVTGERIARSFHLCSAVRDGHRRGDRLPQLHEAFHGIDPRVINPGVWFNHT